MLTKTGLTTLKSSRSTSLLCFPAISAQLDADLLDSVIPGSDWLNTTDPANLQQAKEGIDGRKSAEDLEDQAQAALQKELFLG